MIQSRTLHGCAVLEHNGRTIVLVAGGWNPNLNTTEYLDLSQDDPIWVSGPVLPTKMEELVLTYTDVGVLLIGGFDSTSIQDSDLIYRLVCNTDVISECTWQEFEHLAKAQSSPVVIPIPNSVDLCQNAITTTPQPLSSSTTSTPVPIANVPSTPPEDCSYCPQCARIHTGQVAGHASFGTIDEVRNTYFVILSLPFSIYLDIFQWPWMVSIGWNNGTHWIPYCGGSIISNRTIITAAHCFFSRYEKNFIRRKKTQVRVGDQSLNDDSDDLGLAKTYDILTVIGHPEYEGRGAKHDIALIYTKETIQFNQRIKPICMATQAYDLPDRYAGQNVKFAGFGYYDGSETTSDDLRAANFKILSESTCLARSLYYRRRKAKNVFFCAGNLVSTE